MKIKRENPTTKYKLNVQTVKNLHTMKKFKNFILDYLTHPYQLPQGKLLLSMVIWEVCLFQMKSSRKGRVCSVHHLNYYYYLFLVDQ